MTTYTITLTDVQQKALAYCAVSPQEWIENAVFSRCRQSSEEIVELEVKRKLDAGEPITGSRDDIVLAANIESAAERQIRLDAEHAAWVAEQEAARQAQQQGA